MSVDVCAVNTFSVKEGAYCILSVLHSPIGFCVDDGVSWYRGSDCTKVEH